MKEEKNEIFFKNITNNFSEEFFDFYQKRKQKFEKDQKQQFRKNWKKNVISKKNSSFKKNFRFFSIFGNLLCGEIFRAFCKIWRSNPLDEENSFDGLESNFFLFSKKKEIKLRKKFFFHIWEFRGTVSFFKPFWFFFSFLGNFKEVSPLDTFSFFLLFFSFFFSFKFPSPSSLSSNFFKEISFALFSYHMKDSSERCRDERLIVSLLR